MIVNNIEPSKSSQSIIRITELPDQPQNFDQNNNNTIKLELTNNIVNPNKKYYYELININVLNTLPYLELYKNLQYLNISYNHLSFLKLSGYQNLKILLANNNYITKIELFLPYLTKLDLSTNYIKQIFELSNIPNLKELILKKNSIYEINYENFIPVKNSIEFLDISENLIKFQKVKNFFNIADNFGLFLRKLQTFNINKNPFCIKEKYRQDYENYLIASCEKLKKLNDKDLTVNFAGKKVKTKKEILPENFDIKKVKNKMLELERNDDDSQNTYSADTKLKTINIKYLKEEILTKNKSNKISDKFLYDLEDLVDLYINQSKENNENDYYDSELDDFEEFISLLEQLVNTTNKYEEKFFKIIGKFTIIKNGKFASRSIISLKQRVNNNTIDYMEDVLANIATFLENVKNENIPCELIESLQIFLNESELTNVMIIILKQLIKIGKKVGGYLNFEKSIQDNIYLIQSNYQNTPYNDKQNIKYLNLFNIILTFIVKCLSLESSELLKEFLKNEGFLKLIVINLKKILEQEDEIIINEDIFLKINTNLLNIITCLLIQEIEESEDKIKINIYKNKKDKLPLKILQYIENSRNYYLDTDEYKNFKLNIEKSAIRDRIENKLFLLLPKIYKNKNRLIEQQPISTDNEFNSKKLFNSLTRCYGALLSNSEDIERYLDDKLLPMKIINILGQNEIICPILISSSCDFTYFLLMNSKIINNPENCIKITKKIYSYRFVIPYLLDKTPEFYQSCKIAAKNGEKTMEYNKILNFKYLNSNIMNKLSISIVNLMRFFGKHTNSMDPLKNLCRDICMQMDGLGRDQALINCLKFTSRDVQLSAVKCLYNIPVEELSSEELKNIYIPLKNISSITPETTKIILVLYLIIFKWYTNQLNKGNYANIEKTKDAISIAITLLSKLNLRKSMIESENKHKRELIAVLTLFLISISFYKNTKNYFLNADNIFNLSTILHKEENSIKNFEVGFPIEIEKCHTGCSIENIFNCIKKEIITPYNYVSLRILHHIGDLLLNKSFSLFDLDYELDINDILYYIIYILKERELQRIKQEKSYLFDIENEKINNKKQSKRFTQSQLIAEQKNFIKNFHILMEFVQGKNSKILINKYEKIWEKKLNKHIDDIIYSFDEFPYYYDELNKKCLLNVLNSDNLNINNNNSDGESSLNDLEKINNDNVNNIYIKLRDYLRQEEYYSFKRDDPYDLSYKTLNDDLFQFERYGENEQKLQRIFEEETVDNIYIRSLFISAFLRCIFAVLNFTYDKNIKKEMIKELFKNNNIKIICLLCDSTKFIENNINIKFVIIMKQILENINLYFLDGSENKNNDNNLLKILGYISFMLKKIMYIETIENTTQEKIVFITEVCKCFLLLINQVDSFYFKSEIIKQNTICIMVDFDLISIIIKKLKIYMNKQFEINNNTPNDISITNEKKNKFNILLNNLFEISLALLGNYMSKSPSKKYDIIEQLTNAYIFESVKMRKTYIQEVIENSIMAARKKDIYNIIISKNIRGKEKDEFSVIYFLTNAVFFDYNSKKCKQIILIVTANLISFLESKNFEYSQLEILNQLQIKFIKDLSIIIDNISTMLKFDYSNRVLLQMKKNGNIYGFYFNKPRDGNLFYSILNERNSDIISYPKVNLFSQDKFESYNIKSTKEIFNDTINEIDDNEIKNNDINNNYNKNDIKSMSSILKNNDYDYIQSNNIIINCIYDIKEGNCCGDDANNFNIFGNLFRKKSKENVILVIKEDKTMNFYKENINYWIEINVEKIFKDVENSGVNMVKFDECYTLVDEYNISDFSKIKIIDGTNIYLKDKSGGGLKFGILDDYSYVVLREATQLVEEFDIY